MGYMDISICGSDNAAAMLSNISQAVVKELKKEIKKKDNEFNTDGIVNVALFFEEVIIKAKNLFIYEDEIVALAKKTCEGLDNLIDEAKKVSDTEWDSKDYHIKRYSELRKKIKKWIKDIG